MILRAKFLIADSQTTVENGFVAIKNGKIVDSGKFNSSQKRDVTDLGESILLPGLVNAHCHTEFSLLKGIANPKSRFIDWLLKCATIQRAWSKQDWHSSVKRGLEIMAQNGITSVGDICRRLFLLDHLKRTPLRKVVFCEAIDSDREGAGKTLSEILKIAAKISPTKTFGIGLSPHAPYTVSQKLFRLISKRRCRLATHIAETKEELKFLKKGEGDFVELLDIAGKPIPFETPPSRTPIQYLKKLGILRENTNLIHCNFLTANDISDIAKSRSSVVFCPSSFNYFKHASFEEYKLKPLSNNGVNVALGTDSLASNSDLSIFREMALVRKHYNVSPNQIFRMATVNGIKALFGNAKIGMIRKNYTADCIAIIAKDVAKNDLLEFVVSGGSKVILSMVNGKQIVNLNFKS